MGHRFESVTGFVLAGGASRRMGSPKTLLDLGGETMLQRQVQRLQAVCGRVVVLGPHPSLSNPAHLAQLAHSVKSADSANSTGCADSDVRPDVPIVPDQIPGRGPLGGIDTGLATTRTEFNLFLGCDLPFVDGRLLEVLCRRAIKGGADVTVPQSPPGRPGKLKSPSRPSRPNRPNRIEPLCGVYRRRSRWAVRASLTAGENKVTGFYHRVRVEVVPWRELARAGFSVGIFDNMNTPEDYVDAERRMRAGWR